MTRYTVLWDETVLAAFTKAWVESVPSVRSILTEVANWIDRELAVDAHEKGEADEGHGVRAIVVLTNSTFAKISVVYQVFPADRVVRVVRLTFTVNN